MKTFIYSLIFLLSSIVSWAGNTTYTSVQSGAWGTGSTWNQSPDFPGKSGTSYDVFVKHQVTITGNLTYQNNPVEVQTGGTLIIKAGTTVNFGKLIISGTGKVIVEAGATLKINNEFANTGTLTVNGTFTSGKITSNSGTIEIGSTGSLTTGDIEDNTGTFTNSGYLKASQFTSSGVFSAISTATTIFTGTVTTSGTFTSEGSLSVGGNFVKKSGTATISGTSTFSNELQNNGGVMELGGNVTANSKILNSATLNIPATAQISASSFTNNDTLNLYGKLTVNNTFETANTNTINVSGGNLTIQTLQNNSNNAVINITNSGNVLITGNYSNHGNADLNVLSGGLTINGNFDNQSKDVLIDGIVTVKGTLTNSGSGHMDGNGFLDAATINNSAFIADALLLPQIYSIATGDWNTGTNWSTTSGGSSCGCIPNSNKRAVIEKNKTITITTAVTAASAVVRSGSTLTIESGGSLTGTYSQIIEGTLLINQGAAYIDKAGTSYNGTGKATIALTLPKNRFTYLAAPIQNMKGSDIPQNKANFLFSYSEPILDNWSDLTNKTLSEAGWVAKPSTLLAGQGYAYFTLNGGNYNFSGNLNTGNVSISISKTNNNLSLFDGWNLIGNPYPSPITVTSFLSGNSGKTTGNVYFWDDWGTNGTFDESTDYIQANAAGTINGVNGGVFNGNIAPFQAFFVKTTSNNTIVFTNTMRTISSAILVKKSDDNIRRFRLQVRNVATMDAFNETLIAFTPQATDAEDESYDGLKRKGNPNIALYTFLKDEAYGIQSFGELTEDRDVKLGLEIATAGTYRFVNTEFSLLPGAYVVLKDMQTGKLTNLARNDSYSFESASGTFPDRFVLQFHKGSSLATQDLTAGGNYKIFQSGEVIRIENIGSPTRATGIDILALDGKTIFAQQLGLDSQLEVPIDRQRYLNQLVIVRLFDNHQQFATQKILIR
ncbi:MAG: hypothetical protein RIS47_1362 [Bacteroidota bacterium]